MSNIILIGYRGTGKSSLGKRLARRLGMVFKDTDNMVVDMAGKSIPEIFATDGEPTFRALESEALAQVAALDGVVVATGGGVVISVANRELLRDSGFVVWLYAEEAVIYQRIYNDNNRPALTDLSPLEEIRAVLKKREPWYKEIADLIIDTSRLPFAESEKKIEEAWRVFVG